MNKEQYLRALAGELRKLPKEEYERAIDYYVEYFEDAGPEHEGGRPSMTWGRPTRWHHRLSRKQL